jgi:hypothetical protein
LTADQLNDIGHPEADRPALNIKAGLHHEPDVDAVTRRASWAKYIRYRTTSSVLLGGTAFWWSNPGFHH